MIEVCRRRGCGRVIPAKPPGSPGRPRQFCSNRCMNSAKKQRWRRRARRRSLPFAALVPWIEAAWQPIDHHVSNITITSKGAQVLGVDRNTIYRWQQTGVPFNSADLAADRLGQHPSNIWLEWLDVPWGVDVEVT